MQNLLKRNETLSPGIVEKLSPWAVQNKKAINMCRSPEQGSHFHFLCFSDFPFSISPNPPPKIHSPHAAHTSSFSHCTLVSDVLCPAKYVGM